MALSLVNGNRGTATEKTSDTSLTLTPSGTLAVGSYGLLVMVFDNPDNGAGQTTHVTVTDNKKHVWNTQREQQQSVGAALDGVTVGIYVAELTEGLTASDTVTMTLDVAATAKGAGLAEFSVAGGMQMVQALFESGGSNAAASTSYSVALSGLPSKACYYIGAAAAEGEVDAAVTLDAGYTEIGFGSIGSGTVGNVITNVIARVGYVADTSTGNTFDASSLTSSDRATILVRFIEDVTTPALNNPYRKRSARALARRRF